MDKADLPLEGGGFTLADFIHAWAKRWKLFVGIIFVLLAAGVMYFKTRDPLPFVYRTTVEVGMRVDGALLEPLEALRAKFLDAYIPEVLAAHAQEHGYTDQRYFVEVVDGKEGEKAQGLVSVTLRSAGADPTDTALLEIHQRIADRFVADHARQVSTVKQELAQQKLQVELALEGLQDEVRRIPQKRKLLEEAAALLRKQIDATQMLIATMEGDRVRALVSATSKESIDQSLATTFLLLDGTIAKHREELRVLEDRLFVKLAQERSSIDREEAELKRKQREQEQRIENLTFQIENFRSSGILLPPSRLPRPPLPGVLSQTLAIFGGVGFILGLFLVAFVEFASNVRRQERLR